MWDVWRHHAKIPHSSFCLHPSAFSPYSGPQMLKRRKIRELAMQILFLWDTQQERNEDLARTVDPTPDEDPVTRRQAIDMADGTWSQRQTIDQWIERLAPQWPPRRQPGV